MSFCPLWAWAAKAIASSNRRDLVLVVFFRDWKARASDTDEYMAWDKTIRDVSTYDEYDDPMIEKLRDFIGLEGEPYCRHLNSESEMRSFDAASRELHIYLDLKE